MCDHINFSQWAARGGRRVAIVFTSVFIFIYISIHTIIFTQIITLVTAVVVVSSSEYIGGFFSSFS